MESNNITIKRYPGHKCDLADMLDARRVCPKCGNKMYTDGSIDFCGSCYTELKKVNPCHEGTCDGAQRFECGVARKCMWEIPEKLAQMTDKEQITRINAKKELRIKILERIEKEIIDSSYESDPDTHNKVINTETAVCIIYGVFGVERQEKEETADTQKSCLPDWVTGKKQDMIGG